MDIKEAIQQLTIQRTFTNGSNAKVEAIDMAIKALEMQQKYETQWIDDMDNPLEPLKLSSALNSELFKLEYRKVNKPKEINILDYTVIYALKDCLERYCNSN